MKNIAVMQPYIFPYIGYFQLIKAVDEFVLYDDVNFIKRGWINRNRILIDDKEKLITFPCLKASQNKLINEVEINVKDKAYDNILSTLQLAYSKAPYYNTIYPLVESILRYDNTNIAQLAGHSIIEISKYLDLETTYYYSSTLAPETRGLDKADRLIAITEKLKGSTYINAIGGQEIYEKHYFKTRNIDLYFLEPCIEPYQQFNDNFIAGLSIIDILMFNSKEEANRLINNIKLI